MKDNNIIKLFADKDKCCGCWACFNICPKKAITMKEDEYGFLYPSIDSQKCVECKLCLSVCQYKNLVELKEPLEAYAASRKNEKMILKSASGGVFAHIAEKVIDDNGIVCGCAMEYKDNSFVTMHKISTNKKELEKMYLSKYVQSNINDIFTKIQVYLNSGKLVLFSGTPCQVAGLKLYLKRDYDNLLTIDIVCHGVPSERIFQDYIKEYEKRFKCKVVKFQFRNKENGWGKFGKVCFEDAKGNYNEKILNPDESSYYFLFSKGTILRESCSKCKYNSKERPADITIGDYWGIDKINLKVLKENGGNLDLNKGISCVIVYTDKGKKYFEKYLEGLNIYKSSFENIAKYNDRLNNRNRKNDSRVLKIYEIFGYKYIDKLFNFKICLKKQYKKLKAFLPKRIFS